ncbi:hypothetical protein HK101_005453, partial [Irineochytrium annulatum]
MAVGNAAVAARENDVRGLLTSMSGVTDPGLAALGGGIVIDSLGAFKAAAVAAADCAGSGRVGALGNGTGRGLNGVINMDFDESGNPGDFSGPDDLTGDAGDVITFTIVEPHPELVNTSYAPGCYIQHSHPHAEPQTLSSEDPGHYEYSYFENVRDERFYRLEDVLSFELPQLLYRYDDFGSETAFEIVIE